MSTLHLQLFLWIRRRWSSGLLRSVSCSCWGRPKYKVPVISLCPGICLHGVHVARGISGRKSRLRSAFATGRLLARRIRTASHSVCVHETVCPANNMRGYVKYYPAGTCLETKMETSNHWTFFIKKGIRDLYIFSLSLITDSLTSPHPSLHPSPQFTLLYYLLSYLQTDSQTDIRLPSYI
jgi:hypothetical protein